jgi:glycosyltransferase involved in cell wall biosynthesis
MPAYNAERFIAQAVESVLAQDYEHWELIVVDDGSTDSTSDVIKAFDDSRIRYIFQENRGQAAALNHGLNIARGEYITTLDVDDWYPANSLGDRAAYLDGHPEIGVAYGDGYYCDENGEPFLSFSEHMPSGSSGDVFDLLIVSPFYGTGATVMQRKEVLRGDDIHYDESIVWCQDWDFYIRLAEVTSFGYVDVITINYRIHSASMTEEMPSGRRLESLLCLRKKVLNSERFRSTIDEQKSAFFYDFLVVDLFGNVRAQEEIFKSEAFGTLSNQEQARLQRLTANKYFQEQKEVQVAKRWLWASWKRAPFEPKTAILLMASWISPEVARWMIQKREAKRTEPQSQTPFEMVIPTKN